MSDYASKHIMYFNPSADIISTDIKQKIYHYTSPGGLFAILKSGTIRFTDCQFMNDKSEYTHIRAPLGQALKEVRDELGNGLGEIINSYIEENYEFDTLESEKATNTPKRLKMRYYIFCATDLPDSLGMWNYYVKSGNYQGYNLIISVNNFLDCFAPIKNPDVDVFYGKVVYREKDKAEILKGVIKKIAAEKQEKQKTAEGHKSNETIQQEYLYELKTYLDNFRLFFKDNSFSAEREFRFVIRLPEDFKNTDSDVLRTGFDMKNGIVVPYCELKIDRSNTFSGITLSPMLESDLAKNGLQRYLKSCQYNGKFDIKQSRIPIRY